MRRLVFAAGLAVLLAGCGSGEEPIENLLDPEPNAAMENIDAPAPIGDNVVVGVGKRACAKIPEFAPVYDGATEVSCTTANDGKSDDRGSLTYKTAAAPDAVLKWSREQVEAGGFKAMLNTDSMMSAGDEAKTRSIAVIAAPDGTGSSVTVNWGVKPPKP